MLLVQVTAFHDHVLVYPAQTADFTGSSQTKDGSGAVLAGTFDGDEACSDLADGSTVVGGFRRVWGSASTWG